MDIIESIKTSLIDKQIDSKIEERHSFLVNGRKKVISTLREELENCDEFIISVAFITESGVSLILNQLKQLQDKGVKGKILTGDYQTFTQPKALKRLMEFTNIEIKLSKGDKFHSKGYFFRKGDRWNLIIGSSNLTATALTSNYEWNLKLTTLESGEIAETVLKEFYRKYDELDILTSEMLDSYFIEYNRNNIFSQKMERTYQENRVITPNSMQKEALKNLELLQNESDKALLISATGTGKTYLSCFDVERVKPKKMLFLAHRRLILEKAVDSYKSIIKDRKIGIYGKDEECDYLFAMVQTLHKDEHLKSFKRDYFDYIIIDEVHHGGAKSYQKILDYFKPKFLLGMTATPERTDNFDIFKLFNYKIAYEIRLYDALKEELLVPFHYFGVSDIEIDGKLVDDKTSINNLTVDRRVEYILEKSRFYGYSGDNLHGLIFVSKVEEGEILAKKLSERGVKSLFLSSTDSDEKRESSITKFENGEINYILTVDIFNEGVDIPCVNQVIMLRPTKSSIVYIQQLGRGLRKNKNKEYLVVIDFIGNYEKNFLIPIAISQNSSCNKDEMRRFIQNATDIVPNECSIQFEEIAKERILKNIGDSNFATRKNIERDFEYLYKKLGRVPYLYDFYLNNLIDPTVILKYKKSYDEVLEVICPKIEKTISEREREFLRFLSSVFTPAKRVHEMFILKEAIENEVVLIEDIENKLKIKYNLKNQTENIINAIKHLSKEIFINYSVIKKYPPLLIKSNEKYQLTEEFKLSLQKNKYFKDLVLDLIDYNLKFCVDNYLPTENNTLIPYKSYTKEETFWYLNLDYNNAYQVSGYTLLDDKKVGCLFITVEENSYTNKITDRRVISWFSKTNRCLKRGDKLTKEGQLANNFYRLHIFVKKSSGEQFYYLGEVEKVIHFEETKDKNQLPIVAYKLKLKNAIDDELYRYLWG